MKLTLSALLVLFLVAVAYLGTEVFGLSLLFGIIIPYISIAFFIVGILWRVISWSNSPVPFNIPTVSGQQSSLRWIKGDKLESPNNILQVICRMALEIFTFRSLLRNENFEIRKSGRMVFGDSFWLWLGGLAFHWSLLVILFRHTRYLLEPVPSLVTLLQNADGFFQFALPTLYITDLVVLSAVTYLFARRILLPKIRYISILSDYFAVSLILSIIAIGILMRLYFKVDIAAVKELALGVVLFRPSVPTSIGPIFYIHLFLASVLLAYFPFSKMIHFAGIFFSPTRNLANNSRKQRHINPWDYPVKTHDYEEYEDEFRVVMKKSGLPLDKN